jgi:arsenate reductase
MISTQQPRPTRVADYAALVDELAYAYEGGVLVTMGCGDACPSYPGKRYLDWDVADPNGQSIEVVRDIRDDIQVRVTTLLCDLNL